MSTWVFWWSIALQTWILVEDLAFTFRNKRLFITLRGSTSYHNGVCSVEYHGPSNTTNCIFSLHWRHNDHDGVLNHQPRGCLPKRLFRRRSKKTSKLRVTGICVGNSPGPVNSPHKGPVTRKMFPFNDVIMLHGIAKISTFQSRRLPPNTTGASSHEFNWKGQHENIVS